VAGCGGTVRTKGAHKGRHFGNEIIKRLRSKLEDWYKNKTTSEGRHILSLHQAASWLTMGLALIMSPAFTPYFESQCSL